MNVNEMVSNSNICLNKNNNRNLYWSDHMFEDKEKKIIH